MRLALWHGALAHAAPIGLGWKLVILRVFRTVSWPNLQPVVRARTLYPFAWVAYLWLCGMSDRVVAGFAV